MHDVAGLVGHLECSVLQQREATDRPAEAFDALTGGQWRWVGPFAAGRDLQQAKQSECLKSVNGHTQPIDRVEVNK